MSRPPGRLPDASAIDPHLPAKTRKLLAKIYDLQCMVIDSQRGVLLKRNALMRQVSECGVTEETLARLTGMTVDGVSKAKLVPLS